ncbi:hypothetical protein [Rhodoblastus sp.]|jgi:hypothetical protein|uniref:hypothetical protein n=1 Tax=Rhodoblastus sp. TaxID=1962975 RepID=UPI0025EE9E6D|nr:hypothetical protein [Rhodoblastus sp.]
MKTLLLCKATISVMALTVLLGLPEESTPAQVATAFAQWLEDTGGELVDVQLKRP